MQNQNLFHRLTNTATGESRDILHFHYTAWADFDVPQCDTFLEYLNAVRESKSLEDGVGPPIVHCSAGKKLSKSQHSTSRIPQ